MGHRFKMSLRLDVLVRELIDVDSGMDEAWSLKLYGWLPRMGIPQLLDMDDLGMNTTEFPVILVSTGAQQQVGQKPQGDLGSGTPPTPETTGDP